MGGLGLGPFFISEMPIIAEVASEVLAVLAIFGFLTLAYYLATSKASFEIAKADVATQPCR